MRRLRAAGVKRVRGFRRVSSLTALFILLLLTHCGNVDFFFFVNTGTVEESRRDGLVVIIGTPLQKEAETVEVISGEVPPGMKPQLDGTVTGVPEASGFFEFTIELSFDSDATRTLTYSVEIEP